jgi:hypothetical protein
MRAPITGPSVWLGKDIAHSQRWLRHLSPAHVAELETALAAVKRRGLDWSEIRREDFPIPGLRPLLDDIADELENGSGMMKLRGFPVDRHEEDDLRRMYWGLGTHLGRPVFQNRRGELMRAIRDEGAHVGRQYGQIEGKGADKPFLSSYARTLTNNLLRFHTDRTDAVGLLCVRQAQAGGLSRLCSTGAVHNAILAHRPDLLEVLFADFHRSRLGEESDDPSTVYRLPIFGLRDGRLTSHYSLTFIEAAELVPGVPKLTAQQREAIDVLMATMDELCFEMTLEPGDLQLINSHITYHGRSAFTDDHTSGHDRLLLRLWLSMPNSRALPEGHEVLWRNIEGGALRGGIAQA